MNESAEHSSAIEPVRQYFHLIRQILLTPSDFFRTMPLEGGISRPLAFGLVTHWIAIGTRHLWSGAIGERALPFWRKLFLDSRAPQIESLGRLPWFHQSRDLVVDWVNHAGFVIADPFLTLLKLTLISLLIFCGARMIVPARRESSERVTYESVIRVLGFSYAADLLMILPVVGPGLAWVYRAAVAIIGFSQVYRVSPLRGLAIAFFPYILTLSIFALVAIGSFALLFQLLLGN